MQSLLCLVLAVCACAVAADYLPNGFTTYFSTTTCPPNWREIPSAQGRLIVSVNNPAIAGLTLYEALADREDRGHVHNFTGSVSIPSKNIAADNCCNTDGASNGQYSSNGNTDGGDSGLPFIQLILCSVDGTTVNGSLPFATVGYFNPDVSDCPADWIPFDEAAGRILVPGFDDTEIVPSASPPLGNLEDRVHNHTFVTTLTTADQSFVGVDGCCNVSPSADGTYDVDGFVHSASTGLPYIQLLTCISQEQTFNVELPDDVYLFRPTVGCPTGWELVTNFAGRFVVALPYNGQAGATFGGDSISTNAAQPAHDHSFSGSMNLPSTSIGLASGSGASGYAATGTYGYQGTSTDNASQLPFLLAPFCQRIA